jgi:hypothetical protein
MVLLKKAISTPTSVLFASFPFHLLAPPIKNGSQRSLTMKKRVKECWFGLQLVLAILMLFTVGARADAILQPVSASADVPSISGTNPDNTRNQNSLSIGYTSGVTDFDSYIASIPTDLCCDSSSAWAAIGFTSANMTYDLGGIFTIESMALWNRGLAAQGIRDFRLLVAPTAEFLTPTILGDFTATAIVPGTVGDAVRPEVFTFAPTSAAFVRLSIFNMHGPCCVSFAEVAFERTPVPEPATSVLLLSGLVMVGLAKRKRAGEKRRSSRL